jgi:hypothetical protein
MSGGLLSPHTARSLTQADTKYIILAMLPVLTPVVWVRQLSRFANLILVGLLRFFSAERGACMQVADAFIVIGILYIFFRNIALLGSQGLGPGTRALSACSCCHRHLCRAVHARAQTFNRRRARASSRSSVRTRAGARAWPAMTPRAGSALYALEGTAFILPIELSMQKKEDVRVSSFP